jgi:Spy/CpxP family protein refolding chaperone
MRSTSTFFSAVLALLLAGSPLAAAQTSTAPQQSQKESHKGAAIRSIQVIDVQELKGDVRSQVDALVAHTKKEQMSSLRQTIEATPEALSALKAKGCNSAQVVAINIDEEGVLTLFTKAT